MVYRIGVNHDVQGDREYDQTREFMAYLKSQIYELEVPLIAEEWSDDASRLWKVSSSTVQDLARELGIEYRACDPERDERARQGIEKRDLRARESYWYEKIQDKFGEKMIFVCGSEHLNSATSPDQLSGFALLLAEHGV